MIHVAAGCDKSPRPDSCHTLEMSLGLGVEFQEPLTLKHEACEAQCHTLSIIEELMRHSVMDIPSPPIRNANQWLLQAI